MKKGYKYEELTGKVFGIIEILKRVQTNKKGRYWLCKCLICNHCRVMGTAQITNGKFEKCICSKFQNNTYEECDNYYKIYFVNNNLFFICDKEDFHKIAINYKWNLDKRGYVINNKGERFHRIILNAPEGMDVDHIDGDPLNNLKSNLRICEHINNSRNKSINKNNTSGVIGVWYNKRVNKWVAEIKVNYKKIHLGYFKDINEAKRIRQEAELKYFGEYCIAVSRQGDYSSKNVTKAS